MISVRDAVIIFFALLAAAAVFGIMFGLCKYLAGKFPNAAWLFDYVEVAVVVMACASAICIILHFCGYPVFRP